MFLEERSGDFHPQDWIIVIEALAQWAGAPDGSISRRRERAYELIEAIAAEEGLPADELLRPATVGKAASTIFQNTGSHSCRIRHRARAGDPSWK